MRIRTINQIKTTCLAALMFLAFNLLTVTVTTAQLPGRGGVAGPKPSKNMVLTRDERGRVRVEDKPNPTKVQPRGNIKFAKIPESSMDVQIKKFYIIKEPFKGAYGQVYPYTSVVHVVNFRKKPIVRPGIFVGVALMDDKKNITYPMYKGSFYGWPLFWGTDAYETLKPGENIIRLGFDAPPKNPEQYVGISLKGIKWRYGIDVQVNPNLFGGGDDFREAGYLDFLPDQYILP